MADCISRAAEFPPACRQPSSAALLTLMIAVCCSGCSTAGGTFTLFPNSHRLTDSAEAIAATAPRHHVIDRELSRSALPAWYIQPGDQLLLEVNDFDADLRLAPDQTVMVDGSIDLGRFGRVVVSGLSIEEIESLIADVIRSVEPDVDVDTVNVRLISADAAVFYVLGEVNAPGSFPLIGRETVLDAILAAGGLSDRAAESRIILSRPTQPCSCRVVLPVCYDDIVQLGDTTTNYQIRPGDRIFVASRSMCDDVSFLEHGCELCPEGQQCGCPSPNWSLSRIFGTRGSVTIPPANSRATQTLPLSESPPEGTSDPGSLSEALDLLTSPPDVPPTE